MLEDMYPALVNSPATELADNINSTQTTIKVDDLSKLPDPPNIATLGTTEDCETILYESIDVANSTLTNVTRGFEGVAKAWGQGTPVHRTFTARDYEAMRQNILNLLSALGAHQQASPLDHPDGSVTAAKIAEGAINALAKIAATIRTTPGGTEPNRLAVTDSGGAVGMAMALAEGLEVDEQIFSTPGTHTWVKPPKCKLVLVDIISGGGGGGPGGSSGGGSGGRGGGGGGRAKLLLMADQLPSTVQVVVGEGGQGGANPTDGGSSSFGHLTVLGGGAAGGPGGGMGRVGTPSWRGAWGMGLIGGIAGSEGGEVNYAMPGEWGGGSGSPTLGLGSPQNDGTGASSIFGGGGGGGGARRGRGGSRGGGVGFYGRGGGGASNGGRGADGNLLVCGEGGGGGNSSSTGTGQTGGDGGIPGGGGGGGGNPEGLGGRGGRGEVRVWAW